MGLKGDTLLYFQDVLALAEKPLYCSKWSNGGDCLVELDPELGDDLLAHERLY
jgi:hypothetical protein